MKQYNAISLFSGAMGLDLGIEQAGFDIKVCVEMDKWAVDTIRHNTDIPVISKDINQVSTEEILETAGLSKEMSSCNTYGSSRIYGQNISY